MLRNDQVNFRPLAPADYASQVGDDIPMPDDSSLADAHAELQSFHETAMAETREGIGFALAGRMRDIRRQPNESRRSNLSENVRGKVLASKLVTELESVSAITLDSLLDEPDDWQRQPQLMEALQEQTQDAGKAALILAATLARGQLDAKTRKRLEDALADLTADEAMPLSLFGALEFGVCTPALGHELRRLYHRVSAQQQKISQWLDALGERKDRKRKLRTMLRVVAFELSASGQPIVGNHLAAVINDLQQLLRIIGLEAYCDQTAEALALPMLNGEGLLKRVVELVEQIWLTPDGIAEMLPEEDETQRYRIVQALIGLIQLLSDGCFNDSGHRAQILESLTEYRDKLDED